MFALKIYMDTLFQSWGEHWQANAFNLLKPIFEKPTLIIGAVPTQQSSGEFPLISSIFPLILFPIFSLISNIFTVARQLSVVGIFFSTVSCFTIASAHLIIFHWIISHLIISPIIISHLVISHLTIPNIFTIARSLSAVGIFSIISHYHDCPGTHSHRHKTATSIPAKFPPILDILLAFRLSCWQTQFCIILGETGLSTDAVLRKVSAEIWYSVDAD